MPRGRPQSFGTEGASPHPAVMTAPADEVPGRCASRVCAGEPLPDDPPGCGGPRTISSPVRDEVTTDRTSDDRAAQEVRMPGVTWWGHATCTIEDRGVRVLTDPLFCSRLGHLRRRRGPVPDDRSRR